jgi:hypothetical protein
VTEAEWFAGTTPQPMVRFLLDRTADRKLRLLACALYRARWPAPADPRCEKAVAAAEAFADGRTTLARMEAAGRAAGAAAAVRNADLLYADTSDRPAWRAARALLAEVDAAQQTTQRRAQDAVWRLSALAVKGVSAARRAAGCEVVRDVVGNPFRPVAFDPSWRSSAVLDLARHIDTGRAFVLMPVLADALADAGCDDEVLLGHARGGGGHWKGCWLLDGLLDHE